MSNDEEMIRSTQRFESSPFPYLNIPASFVIPHSDFPHLVSPPLTGITYWRQAFAKVRLLTFGFPLLVRIAGLLFRAWPWTGTAQQCDKEHRNEKCRGRQLFHIKLRTAS